jgi:gliding motility-associated-like protein
MNTNILYGMLLAGIFLFSSCEKCIPVVLCPYRNQQFYSIEGGDTTFLFYPNAFSPNGDGLNDQFAVLATHNITSFTCQIYDASGKQIYEITNQTYPWWDGLVNGKQVPVGLYAVQINATTNKGKEINLNGTLSLVGGQILGDDRKIEGNVYLELKNTQFESQIDFGYVGFNPNISSNENILTTKVNNCN